MPSRPTKAATPRSAALLFNNLAGNGRSLAYTAYSSAVIVPEAPVLSGSSSAASQATVIDDPDGAQLLQVRWVALPSNELLVMASQKSLQLYTADASRLMHVVTAKDIDGEALASYRGIGSCETGHAAYVCAGVSTGAVCLVPIFGDMQFGDSLLSPASQHPIVDLTAGQAPHNDPSRALICSADAVGDVHVHALESDGTWGHCTTFSASTADGTPSLCTSLRMRGVRLYCAYSTGHVRIFDLVSCSMSVQISAHARWINSLEVHPNGSLFATASEDTTIGLWALTETGAAPKVTSAGHITAPDALLTGVAFCGGFDKTHVAASAYDQAALQAWKLD